MKTSQTTGNFMQSIPVTINTANTNCNKINNYTMCPNLSVVHNSLCVLISIVGGDTSTVDPH